MDVMPPNAVPEPTPGSDPNRPIYHEVYFKLHKSFDSDFAEPYCKKLLNEVNKVFAKNTNRRFIFRGFDTTDTWPTGASSFIYPDKGFKIIIYIVPPDTDGRQGGSSLIEDGDIIVIYNTYKIENIPTLNDVNTICHEIAHGFGVAIGEYYTIDRLVDFTGIQPEYKVNNLISKDNYWHTPEKYDWLSDPMLGYPTASKFCWLSSYIINSGKFRCSGPPLPDLNSVHLNLQYNNQPISSSYDIMIWRNSKLFTDKIDTFSSDISGNIDFSWNAGENNHWSEALSDNFRIIKVYDNGKHIMSKGISIWDVQQAYIQSNYSSSYRLTLKSDL